MIKRTGESHLNTLLRKFLIFDTWAEKVMLADLNERVPSNSNLRCSVLNEVFSNILFDLYRANCARPIYEAAVDLPLDDLFYVGGQLQSLIRKAESILFECEIGGYFMDYYTSQSMRSRIEEAKSFRRYIVKRIRKGS